MAMETMPSEEDCAKAAKVVETVARESFPKTEIMRVKVDGGPGSDGEPVLWIRILVDIPVGAPIDIDAHTRFQSNLAPKLREVGIYAFPVSYFDLVSEMGEVA